MGEFDVIASRTVTSKRLFDVLLAAAGLLFSWPLWMFIAACIKLEDAGPVFYFQKRVGKNGKPFWMAKFRSMIPNAEKGTGAVWASAKDERVTKVGRILRATAMDELPQLWNILKGDISFVGPRAERPEFIEKFRIEIPNYDLRLRIRPGLTGTAQVYGRYDSSPRDKLRLDLLYIQKQTFGLDIKLILLSFWITFHGKWEHRGRKIQAGW
jgi:lipopolysaccharide/colanic/teichoic acid biosynthesis glycosyltransferase